jgi:hypothetical protein
MMVAQMVELMAGRKVVRSAVHLALLWVELKGDETVELWV